MHLQNFTGDDATTLGGGEKTSLCGPSPTYKHASLTSNRLLREFLTANSKDENFLSDGKGAPQYVYSQSQSNVESAHFKARKVDYDDSVDDLTLSKDPYQQNSSRASRKEMLGHQTGDSAQVPESLASLQNTKQIELGGIHQNLDNF